MSFFKKNDIGASIALAILLSFLFHVIIFGFFWILKPFLENRPPIAHAPVMVKLTPPPKNLPIVDTPAPQKEEAPEKPSAQGLHNQKVTEEEVSPSRPGSPGTPQPNTQTKSSPPPKEKAISLGEREKKSQKSGQGGYMGEYLPGFKVGSHNYINIQANPQIAYFVELRRKFAYAWNPRSVFSGKIFQGKSITTVVGFSINSSGELVEMRVIEASPLEEYDRESRRTVQVSAPFSSPPSELINPADGLLRVGFSFIVDFR